MRRAEITAYFSVRVHKMFSSCGTAAIEKGRVLWYTRI